MELTMTLAFALLVVILGVALMAAVALYMVLK